MDQNQANLSGYEPSGNAGGQLLDQTRSCAGVRARGPPSEAEGSSEVGQAMAKRKRDQTITAKPLPRARARTRDAQARATEPARVTVIRKGSAFAPMGIYCGNQEWCDVCQASHIEAFYFRCIDESWRWFYGSAPENFIA